jgi:hypothetical protein
VRNSIDKIHRDELLQRIAAYESALQLFALRSSVMHVQLCDVVDFLSHLCTFYPAELSEFPQQIKRLLEEHHVVMHAEVVTPCCRRQTLMQFCAASKEDGHIAGADAEQKLAATA